MCCDDELWECPTCTRPLPPEHDHECSTCGLPSSHHISVRSMCKRVQMILDREASLKVEINEQCRLLGMSAEREAKLMAEIDSLRVELLRAKAWPHDPDPFTSADHDNDHTYP